MSTTDTKITNPADLAAAYGLPWPDDACRCCGGEIVDGRCLGADRCDTEDGVRCAGVDATS
jgi:hypothetical protein